MHVQLHAHHRWQNHCTRRLAGQPGRPAIAGVGKMKAGDPPGGLRESKMAPCSWLYTADRLVPAWNLQMYRRCSRTFTSSDVVCCVCAECGGVYESRWLAGCMGFLWVTGFSFLHCVASPFHSFVSTCSSARRRRNGVEGEPIKDDASESKDNQSKTTHRSRRRTNQRRRTQHCQAGRLCTCAHGA